MIAVNYGALGSPEGTLGLCLVSGCGRRPVKTTLGMRQAIQIDIRYRLPVVPHKAVAEVARIGNL